MGLMTRSLTALLVVLPLLGQPTTTKKKPMMSMSSLAIEELKAKAEAGEAAAQEELGRRYEEGTGVPKDSDQALTWFAQAAMKGNCSSQTRMGDYFNSEAVPEDPVAAAGWYRKAAEQGGPWAQFNSGASTSLVGV